MGEFAETEKMLQKAIALKKEEADLYYMLGVIQVKKEEFGRALKNIKKAIELEPEKVDYVFYLGATYEKLKKYNKSIEAMKRAVKLNPNHSDALNYIGYLYADQNMDLDEAHEYLKRALEIEPNNGYYLDSLGWIYYKQGKYRKALKTTKEAIKNLKMDDATIFEHLGDINAALKKYEDAAEAYSGSLKVKDDPKVKKKLDSTNKKIATGNGSGR
jgi:tetratricopeptide (TPR) repeat protein